MIKVPFFAPRNIRREFSEFFLVNSSISAKGQQIRSPLYFSAKQIHLLQECGPEITMIDIRVLSILRGGWKQFGYFFYEIRRVEEKLPEIINIDETPLDDSYEYISEDEAEDWQKNIGQKCTIQYLTVNTHDVCIKLTGKEPSHMAYGAPWEGVKCYDKAGNLIVTISDEIFERFRFIKEVPSFIYCKEIISSVCQGTRIHALADGFLTYDDLILAARECVDEIYDPEWDHSGTQTLYVIMKAAFYAKDKGSVFCKIY
ncbi:MAG: hypothetical protein IJI14_15765 [Anaerolineaceae bacterium]|nr:hypothetical protein [Anaerolineaceae bacterium]